MTEIREEVYASIAAACPPSRAAQARRAGKAAPTGINLVGVMEYCRFRDLVSRLPAPTSDAFIDNRRGGVYPHPQAFYCFRALRDLRG